MIRNNRGAWRLADLSLRFILSTFLLLALVLANIGFYFYNRHRVHESTTKQARERLRQHGAMSQAVLEYSFRHRLERLPQITVVGAGDDEKILMAIFVDSTNRVLASSRLQFNGLNLSEIAPEYLVAPPDVVRNGLKAARLGLDMYLEYIHSREMIIGFQPVYMLGESRVESQIGVLILFYDLAEYLKEAERGIRTNFLIYSGFSVILVVLLEILFYFLVTRRTSCILRSISAYGSGSRGSRIKIGGGDELGQMATSINQLMDQVEAGRLDLERKAWDLEKVNAAVEESRREAEAASRAKTQFVANVSHEVRTPLNAILGLSDMLIESELGNQQREYVSIIQKAGYGLLNLINDLLDVSKIEAGKMSLSKVRFLIDEIVLDIFHLSVLRTDEKRVELIYRRDPRVDGSWDQDPNRVRQILMNLISNAIKFTDAGKIEVEIGLNETRRPGTHLIRVKDSGMGITSEEAKSLFHYFTQANDSVAQKFGGTGLGLGICKKLAELMGGTIWVESELGIGSTFYVTLDVAEVPKTDSALLQLSGANLLILGSEEMSEHLILKHEMDVFKSYGLQVKEQTMASLKAEDIRRSHLIVVLETKEDLIKAHITGDRIDALREMAGNHRVVLLVSKVTSQTFHDATFLGGAQIIVSPASRFSWEKIMLRLNHFASGADPARVDNAFASDDSDNTQITKEKRPLAPGRILLVDDSDDNRMLIRAFLQNQPIEIVEASDGLEAVAAFRAEQFDLVLMDIQMPGMDGYAATRHIRTFEEAERTHHVPIFALTAGALPEERKKALASGCTEFLTKPISKRVLLDVVDLYLKSRPAPMQIC